MIGCAHNNTAANAETDECRSTNNTQAQANENPKKYEPPSPKNSLPIGQLTIKKPNTHAEMMKQALAKYVSPKLAAKKATPNKAQNTMLLAKPLSPSMMLTALATPPTAKAVKSTETTVN